PYQTAGRLVPTGYWPFLGIKFVTSAVSHREEVRFARVGALHGSVRPRAFVRLEQIPARSRHPADLRRDHSSDTNEMDWGRHVFRGRVGSAVSRTQDRRQSPGIFSGTCTFA